MKFVVLSYVIIGLFGYGLSLECGSAAIGIDWTASHETDTTSNTNDIEWGWSTSSTVECLSDICASSFHNINVTYDVNNPWIEWLIDTGSFSFQVTGEFCGNEQICNSIAGGTDSCRHVTYDFQQWYPTSCLASQDYHATIIDYNIQYKYACCTTQECNDNYNYDTCVEDNQFSGYVSDLYECWNGVRKDWMKYLKCDGDGLQIYNWEGDCTYNGAWNGQSGSITGDCDLIATCSVGLQYILSNFSACACQAADASGYTGEFITEAMETHWTQYCGNAKIECLAGGGVNITLTYYIVTYDFYIDIDVTTINDTVLTQIEIAISNSANVDLSLIAILTYVDGGVYGRRLLDDSSSTLVTVQVTSESQGDSDAIASSLNSDAEANINSETGHTSTGGTTTQSTETTSTESAGFGISPSFSLVVLFGIILVTIQNIF